MNKELPKNIEAEKCLLGSMFWSRESLQRGCEEADKDIFYLDDYIEDKSKPVEWYCKFHSIYNFRYII